MSTRLDRIAQRVEALEERLEAMEKAFAAHVAGKGLAEPTAEEEELFREAQIRDQGVVDPDVATVEEFAIRLKVSPKTIRLLIRAGDIRAEKVGRSWRIRWIEIHRLVSRYHDGDTFVGYAVTSDGKRHDYPGVPSFGA